MSDPNPTPGEPNRTTFTEAVSREPVGAFQFAIVALVTLSLVLDGIDFQILPLVAPSIVGEWGVARAEFGWPLSAALVGMGIGAFFGGRLGDRLGRHAMLTASIVLFGLATLVTALAENVATMTLLRFVGGLGFGAVGPNCLALSSEWMPQRYRTYVVAVLAIGTPAGTMIGAALIPLLEPQFGWRGTHAIFGLASIALGLLIMLIVRESPSYLLSRGKAALAHHYARIVIPAKIELQPEAAAETKGGPAIGVFHRSNLRLNVGIGASFVASAAIFYGLTSWSPLMLEGLGFAKDQLANANFALGLVSVFAALLGGYVVRAFGSKRVMGLCAVLTGASVIVLALVIEGIGLAPSPAERWAVYALIGFAGGAASVGVTTIYAMMTLGYPVSCRSAGIGYGMLMGRIGGVLMSLAGGYLLDLWSGSVVPFFAVVVLCALVVGSSVAVIDRHIPRPGR